MKKESNPYPPILSGKGFLEDRIKILGFKVIEKITGFKGVATSVSFDLYGCIQVLINPGLDKDGRQKEQYWFDYTRVEIADKKPVMPCPKYIKIMDKGSAEKPVIY